MKRKISLFLTFIMLVSMLVPLSVISAELKWPTEYNLSGLEMPFFPYDKYVTHQNPPDFSWSAVNGSTYDLIVCRDQELKEIVYEKRNITTNFYNFEHTFEIDTYYWSVRYKKDGGISEWSPARRFRISPDASEFPVPDVETLASRIPKEHPRLWMKDGLEGFRAYSKTEKGAEYLKMVEEYIREHINDPIVDEPQWEDFPTQTDKFYNLRGEIVSKIAKCIAYGAFMYLMTDNAEYGNFAKKYVMAFASWDPEGVSGYYSDDQSHREITLYSAIGYDWLYPLFNEEEKKQIIDTVRKRSMIMAKDLVYDAVSISERPYESHGSSAYSMLLILSMVLYDDMLPEAPDLFRRIIPTVINTHPIYSKEDGGFSQGVFYYKGVATNRGAILDYLYHTGIIDARNKAWCIAEQNFPMHTWPAGSVGAFGDGSYVVPTSHMTFVHSRIAAKYKNPYSKWAAEELGDYNVVHNINDGEFRVASFMDIMDGYFDFESEPPYTLEKGRRFKDIGWATMHSDLVDQRRISLFFKSSPYGSYNHSQADQNSFVIQGFGERLAIDSGYYAYDTDWEKKYVRQTFAHNGITIDGGKGQLINDFTAKGYLTEHINSTDFDVVRGDAVEAYVGALTKANRNIIYVRPDMYIVIDDLATARKKGSKFEFWLNAMSNCISVDKTTNAIRIKKNAAVLDATMLYPKKVNIKYSDIFSGADLNPVPTTETYKKHEVQQRAWFETDTMKQTKMVTALDVHLADDKKQNIKTSYGDGFMKMELENGTTVYVNIGDSETVDCGSVKFTGLAYVENAYSKMLVTGSCLEKNGEVIFESDIPLSVSLGRGIIDISASDDCNISVKAPGANRITDSDGNELSKKRGITVSVENDVLSFKADKGDYKLAINDAPTKPTVSKGKIRLITDGVEKYIEADKITDLDGTVTMHGNLINESKKYILKDKSAGFNVLNALRDEVTYITENAKFSSYNCENPYVVLESVEVPDYEIKEFKNHEKLKEELDVIVEAESFISKTGITYASYKREFMSNHGGAYQIYDEKDTLTYEFEIPEDGYYDLCVKGVAWVDGTKREFVIDNYAGMFMMPKTPSWGAVSTDWTSERVYTNLYLTKGTHKMVIQGINNYSNFDWFGFIKN